MKPLRVLDIGQLVAGPVAATILADLGADVIHIEDPRHQDALRAGDTRVSPAGGCSWLLEGRNKRCVTLNLRNEKGKELFKSLVVVSDVVIENFGAGRMEALGLGPSDLWEVNPKLVLVRVSGFGQDGPYSHRRAIDITADAYSGLLRFTGAPGTPQVVRSVYLADYTAALLAGIGALEAVRRAQAEGGKGQVVDVSLYDALLRMVGPMLVHYGADETKSDPSREALRFITAPCGLYECGDGKWITIASMPGPMFERFARAIGADWAFVDGEINTSLPRADVDMVEAKTREWVAERDSSTVIEVLDEAGVCVARVNSIADIAADEHLNARGDLIRVEDSAGRSFLMPGVVPRIEPSSSTTGRSNDAVNWPGLLAGESNEDVLGELLGLGSEVLAALAEEGVV